MKRPLAYISAAWSGDGLADSEQAVKYCRAVYEAGFPPSAPGCTFPCISTTLSPANTKTEST